MTCKTVVQVRAGGATVRVGSGSSKRITLDARTVAKITDNRPTIVPQVASTPVDVTSRPTVVRTGGGMGVQGAPGETEGATFLAEAATTIHGLRAVRIANGHISHPDIAVAAHADETIGIAMQSGVIGANLLVRTAGTIEEGGWNWAPGFVFCGADGVLTQTPGTSGWLLTVGRAINPTTLEVDLDTPFMRQ